MKTYILSNQNKITEILFGLFFITYPFSESLNYIVLSFLAAQGVVVTVHSRSVNKTILFLTLPSVLLFILLVISLLNTSKSGISDGLFFLERSLSFLAFPLIGLLLSSASEISYRRINNFILIASTVTIGFCLLNNVLYFYTQSIPFSDFFNWEYNYHILSGYVNMHPTYLSIFISLGMGIVFLRLIASTKRDIIVLFFIFIFHLLFLFLLGSKIVVFAAVLSLILMIIRVYSKMGKVYHGIMIATITLLAIIFLVLNISVMKWRIYNTYNDFFNNPLNVDTGGGINLRIQKWNCAIDVIKKNWLFGTGVGDGQMELNICYSKNNFIEGVENNYDSHNQFFSIWIKTGILGFLLLLLQYIINVMSSFIARNYESLFFFIIVFITSFTEGLLDRRDGIILFMIMTIYTHLLYMSSSK